MSVNEVLRILAAAVAQVGGEVTLSPAELDQYFDFELTLVDVADGTGIRVRASVSYEEDDQ